ncbi:TIGR00659 family protein [Salinibacillus kushneri]|uniref:TIGR00659 family protein n=1 Tax=Salinibacillus kushneri TaxID=237682 RepID=A0A1I0B934_9BACI|nr:LrgB family protein [Salinibacillus kushneri]SET03265.1 TIGR00659 family protein [Salinibacillus kushneri]
MNSLFLGLLGVIGTLIAYMGALYIYQKYPYPILLPVFVATVAIAITLILFHIPYDAYMQGGKWIDWLLGPAVVALAYPLYNQWEMVKKYPFPLLAGVGIGSLLGITTGLLLAKWLHFDHQVIYSLIPKNSTTPVAMEITESLGGIAPMATVFVMIAGIGGAITGPAILKRLGITHFLAIGIGVGSASHAIGTSKVMEYGVLAGAVSTVAMSLSAVVISILSPILTNILM